VSVIGLLLYTSLHSLILCLEMFTLHVVLTSSFESLFSFLFYNNLCEIKITVFKKCDVQGLYTYASNDSVERFQLLIYLTNVILTTSQDKSIIVKYCLYLYLSEGLTDQIKHFFVRRLNNLDSGLYE